MEERPQVQFTTPAAAYRLAVILNAALMGGVFIYAAVAWFLTSGGRNPLGDPATGRLLFLAWLAVAVGGLVAVQVLWRARVEPAEGEARTDAAAVQQLVGNLVMCWALIEGPGLLGVTAFLLGGRLVPLLGGLVLVAGGLVFWRPRREWFGA